MARVKWAAGHCGALFVGVYFYLMLEIGLLYYWKVIIFFGAEKGEKELNAGLFFVKKNLSLKAHLPYIILNLLSCNSFISLVFVFNMPHHFNQILHHFCALQINLFFIFAIHAAAENCYAWKFFQFREIRR